MKKIIRYLPSLLILICCGSAAAGSGNALQIQKTTSGSVESSSNIIFDSILYLSGNISYNGATGVVTFLQAGRYLVFYNVAYQGTSVSPNQAVTALVTSQGDYIKAASPSPNGQVSGVGIIDISAAPTTMSLINAGTGKLICSQCTLVVWGQP